MSHFEIEIIDQQDLLEVNGSDLISLTHFVLEAQSIRSAEIHVLLVDNAAIHALNRAHLQHDFATDVITFPLNDADQQPPDFPLEGEIVISTQMAIQMANSLNWSPNHELALYLIHGLLHLCGYDDLDQQSQRQMRQRELELLQARSIVPAEHDDRWG